jgi:hypothetical protein
MSIEFPGGAGFRTPSPGNPFASVTAASVFLWLEFRPDVDPSRLKGARLWGSDGSLPAWLDVAGAGTHPDTVRVSFNWVTDAGRVGKTHDLAIGTAYPIGMTIGGGAARYNVAGKSYSMGSISGPLSRHRAIAFQVGAARADAGSGSVRLQDVAMFPNLVLTDAQFAGLRDGTLSPTGIGPGVWWSMRGPIGQPVAIGEPGLANFQGVPYSLSEPVGGSAAVYGPELGWKPQAEIAAASVLNSGRMIKILMKSAGTGKRTIPQACAIPPTLIIDDKPVGPLIPRAADASMECALFEFPPDVRAEAGSRVEIDAPANWMETTAGFAGPVKRLDVDVCIGRSAYIPADFVPTLRPGVNVEFSPNNHTCAYAFLRNRAKMIGGFRTVTEYGEDQRPLRFAGTTAIATVYDINSPGWPNGIDDTGTPGPEGLWRVWWVDEDDADPFAMRLYGGKDTAVAERKDLENKGEPVAGGTFKARVFEVRNKPVPPSVSAAIAIHIEWRHSKGVCSFDRWGVNGPGDFAVKDGVPTAYEDLDDDPYALSARFLDREQNTGSFRCWTPLIAGVGLRHAEREHLRKLEHFSWGWYAPNTEAWSVGWRSMEPFDADRTPWVYSRQFGEMFAAELVQPVKATDVKLIIKDAEQVPVFYGLRLFINDEVMRVEGVAGDEVEVTRAMEGTEAAGHEPGPIRVGYRARMSRLGEGSFFHGVVFKLVADSPHRLESSYTTTAHGSWPSVPCADGRVTRLGSMTHELYVTGTREVVVKTGPWQDPCVTTRESVPLDPTQHKLSILMPHNQLPYPMVAKMRNQCGAKAQFYAIPPLMTDDGVRHIAGLILEHQEPGGEVWCEDGCEPWNFPAQKAWITFWSHVLHPGEHYYASHLDQLKRRRTIMREEFAKRGREDEVKYFVNVHFYNPGDGAKIASYAAKQGIAIDGFFPAPYLNSGYLPSSVNKALAVLDVPECIDAWNAGLNHRVSGGFVGTIRQWVKVVSDYNAATGHDAILGFYEGGFEKPFGGNVPNDREKDRDFLYHPNLRQAMMDLFALAQGLGVRYWNLFFNCGPYQKSEHTWAEYAHYLQPHGRGDGSDGGPDNRRVQARPGLPNSKPPAENYDRQLCSVRGQARLDWNKRAAGVSELPAPVAVSVVRPSRNRARAGRRP